jgi:hypothetical protein
MVLMLTEWMLGLSPGKVFWELIEGHSFQRIRGTLFQSRNAKERKFRCPTVFEASSTHLRRPSLSVATTTTGAML